MEATVNRGPKAVIECTEDIPCNPCATCCSKNAITLKGDSIIDLPVIDESLCNGCGICVAKCPGMAIFVVDQDKGEVSFPYEFLPLPEKGQSVEATDRQGKVICQGEVSRVMQSKQFDHTTVMTIAVPPEYVDEVRGIRNAVKGGR